MVRSLNCDSSVPSGDMPLSSFQSGLDVNKVRFPVFRLTDQMSTLDSRGPPSSTYVASAPPLVKVLNSVSALLLDQASTFGSVAEVGPGALMTRGSVTVYWLPSSCSLPTIIASIESDRASEKPMC